MTQTPDLPIGDVSPLDAWDDGDPEHLKLGILEHLVENLDHLPDAERADALRLVAKMQQVEGRHARRLRELREQLEG